MSSSYGSRLGRLLQKECLAAIEVLAAPGSIHVRVHEARKAIRRARSLIALAATQLDTGPADGILQRVGDSLGSMRDAHASALTAACLDRRLPGRGWKQAAIALDVRADRLAKRELADDPGFAKRRRAIRRAARQLESLPWDTLPAAAIRQGVSRQTRRMDNAARRARKAPTPENLHRLRRRGRRLRMQVDALAGLNVRFPGLAAAESKRLRRLSDDLGWDHDLVVLAAALRRMRTLEHRGELLEHLRGGGLQAMPR